MDFATTDAIAAAGFSGFVTIEALRTCRCSQVPAKPGIYMVLRPDTTPPVFLPASVGGHFKGKDPTVSVAALQTRWTQGAIALYVGKAGSPDGGATLRSRLRQLVDFGCGKPVGHWGGRCLWQLQGSRLFHVCWKTGEMTSPADEEAAVIESYKLQYGRRPFANLQG